MKDWSDLAAQARGMAKAFEREDVEVSERYPFTDLRPKLILSRSIWEAEGEERQRLLLREAFVSGCRIEIVEDEDPPAPR